jgi:hypothetical protein
MPRLALGGPEQVKEQYRDARRTRWLEDLLPAVECRPSGIFEAFEPNLDFAFWRA